LRREFVRGRTPGQQYKKINTLLKRLANDLGIDLWTLDAIMWGLLPKGDGVGPITTPTKAPEPPIATYSFLAAVQHPYLQSRLARLSHVPHDTLLREAGVVFETHLREKVDPDGSMFGTGLVEEALKPGGRIVFSTHKGGQEEVENLYKGAMQFIRNPPMHKIIDYPESMAEQYLRLIDSLMILLDEATKTK
jgi:hypothetical protein